MRVSLIALLLPAFTESARSVSWWFEVAENFTTDSANFQYLASLPKEAVTRVMPDMPCAKGDPDEVHNMVPVNVTEPYYGIYYGDAWIWWELSKEVSDWYPALKAAVPHAKISPWILDTTNATLFHEKVLPNATAFIADAVNIAKHYGFDGWHIDYEDEHPSDTYPSRDDDLRGFLKQFGDALHAEGLELVFDVASWSGLLSNFENIAASGIDQLQDMSFYGRPSDYVEGLASYYEAVKKGNPESWADAAGVGIGIYYDGRNGYNQAWTEDNTREFFAEIVKQGGNSIDIFRLCLDDKNGWPHDDWWTTLISDFALGKDF